MWISMQRKPSKKPATAGGSSQPGAAQQWKRVRKQLVSGIRDYFSAAGFGKAVLGLSGGIDSALTAKLVCEAIGAKNVTLLLLPEPGVSPEKSVKRAEEFAGILGARKITVPVDKFVEEFDSAKNIPWAQSKIAKMNTRARVRMALLYNFANSSNALVAGTGNRSEIMLGYFTKHGDEACDFLPLGGLWKSQVYELAKHIGLPGEFIKCEPSAELCQGQSDAGELGASYGVLDRILALYVEKGKSAEEICGSGFERQVVENTIQRVKGSRHKRAKPIMINVALPPLF